MRLLLFFILYDSSFKPISILLRMKKLDVRLFLGSSWCIVYLYRCELYV